MTPVLHIAHSAQPGGSGSILLSLLRHAPAGVASDVVFLEDGPLVGQALALGARTALVDPGRAREAWKAPGAIRALRAAIRTSAPDIVIGHITKATLYAAPAAWLEEVPFLWFQNERRSQKPLMHDVAGRLPAAAVVCLADWLADEQRARYPGVPVQRIYPGPEVSPGARVHEHGAGLVLGVVGRLQRWKRVELAIAAMPAILAAEPRAALRVLGAAAPGLDEDYPAELAAAAREYAVDGAVEFAGHVADGAAAIRELDVLVHTAELEPFGLVLVEAMLAGVPVVAAREGGPVEIVRDGVDGLLVDATDAAAVASAALELLHHPERRARMGAAGRQRALERFTAERMSLDTFELAAQVASGRYARSASCG